MTTSAASVIGRHYQSGQVVRLQLAGGRIAGAEEVADPSCIPQPVPWLAPGFVDVQINGYGGQEFSSPGLTVERVAEIARKQAAFGVTQFCPTVTTSSSETILHGLRTIVEACGLHRDVAYAVTAIHLEGPYISAEDGPRGAHPLVHCRPPDWDEFQRFQEAAQGRIRIVTLAAEYPTSPQFIRHAAASGVVAAIGHTSADSAQIAAAVDAGAKLSTHLGNGAHRVLRRHPNYIWDQLANDRLMASLIVDGHHLPPAVVQSLVRAKTPERCLLVSDLSGMAGLPPGRYPTELCELEILADGRLVIAGQDQLLAGASRGIDAGVANVMRFAGVDLATAVDMATKRPRGLLGLLPNNLAPGDAADLVVFDLPRAASTPAFRLDVRSTVAGGQVVSPQGG
jgi:N-acetylglucosamine-6-phosphate deacetylase